MKVLFIHPLYPTTFWSFKYALKFISKKAILPPLGLITISAMLPEKWERKLVDLNVSKLSLNDLIWADMVFISAMNVQRESVEQVIKECKLHNKKLVAGGPLFTQCSEDFSMIDHLILNEAEITLPMFIRDLEMGNPQHIYQTSEFPDICQTPVPDYKLLALKKYSTLSVQYSRGCPFSCDFCEIPYLFGHKVRTKDMLQILDELEKIYNLNWRGQIFIVDDNFIGNKKKLKNDFLPELINWMKVKKYPFEFITEASIDLADDEKLMDLMSEAGFTSVFIGIETPEEKSLEECKKIQNRNRDLLQSIRKINNKGLQVSAGFIVGFDSDTTSIFQRQIDFIQQSGIITAMVGLLNAPRNTKLYKRLHSENRILPTFSGNNTDFNTNIIPKMSFQDLQTGYRKIIREIYSIKPFYQRIRIHLRNCKGGFSKPAKISVSSLKAFFESIIIMGFIDKGRFEFWKLFIWSMLRGPAYLTSAIAYSIYGYHFRKVYELANQKNPMNNCF
jgi:radical SAM superfamily enzyme YgiQ (UPF0313 family)